VLLSADVGKTRRLRSPIIQSSHNPRWDQRATVYVADEADDITAEIKVGGGKGPRDPWVLAEAVC
jgi:hypothetical protein